MHLLSICIPTYNRKEELRRLLETIPHKNNNIEVIIVDDGSNDNTYQMIDEYIKENILCIRYEFQENKGRAIALKNAIQLATGKYTILMDSDDFFINGWYEIVAQEINRLPTHEKNSAPLKGLIFGVSIMKNNSAIENLPPSIERTNFIKLRADEKIKGDLKEIVETHALKLCLYNTEDNVRRVPTYLLWAKFAESNDCKSIKKSIAIKEYLPGGMTDRILKLKTKYSEPMISLYLLLSQSTRYQSSAYRWKCRLLWSRHSWHGGKTKFNYLWQLAITPIGFLIFLLDKTRLLFKKND